MRRLAVSVAVVLVALVPASARAAVTAIPGSPLTVYVGDQGQLQAVRAPETDGIFFRSTNQLGDAGFFLAFRSGALTGVYGFEGDEGPTGLQQYTPTGQDPVTGSGTAASPYTQVTRYSLRPAATDLAQVTQTTTYVNGSQEFTIRWDVKNTSGGNLGFKALAAADFFFQGSDRGTGIFTAGPPRFIGGTNVDSGSSGGFGEVLSGSPPWSAYEALQWPNIWTDRVQAAADADAATFNNTVLGTTDDNAGGVEWDQKVSAPLANNETFTVAVVVRSAVPSALQLNPTQAISRRGVPINITATASDTNGQPYAGKTLRYQIIGVNPLSAAVPLNAAGSAVMTDPGANAGEDTVIAYVDFNGNGTREELEPQASALTTFVDNVAPTCTLKISGDRPGGGGAGKPLVIQINCGEGATVTIAGSLRPPATKKSSATAVKRKPRRKRKPRAIKLKKVTHTVAAGKAFKFKLKVPKKVARRYAGKRLKATFVIRAKDPSGNVRKMTKRKTIKLRALAHKKKKQKRGR